MLFFIPWMTQLTKCRQLLNLAVGCHHCAPGQEVFSIDMTNQFPGLKIGWGISGQNRALSLISTCLMPVRLKASHFGFSFFPGHHFTWHFLLHRLKLMVLVFGCYFFHFDGIRGYLNSRECLLESVFSYCLFYFQLLLNHHPPEVDDREIMFTCLCSTLN